jgi:hypothetical protein
MKKLLLVTLIAFVINAKAQITLEHVYDTASMYSTLQNALMIVNFEVSGERYVRINNDGKTIDIYDINHSFVKSISFAGFPQNSNNITHFLYFSENLFNTDPKMEFMYINFDGNPTIVNTRIYNEDGLLIFRADSMAPLVIVNIPQQQFPIYNTSQGTKMILSHQFTGQAKVYSLPGTLSQGIQEANNVLIAAQSNVSNPFPNPNNGSIHIDYAFPPGESEGEIVFYDLQGMEVKSFKVDKTFNTLLISTKDLAAGTYYYQLQTSSQNSGGKKMVVIK